MNKKEDQGGVVVVMGRAEIDTRAPFKSVKEAVMLFGEKVLAGEIITNKLKEIRAVSNESGQARSNIAALKAELDETKQALQREREENNLMAYRIKSLREELEHAKKELKHLKSRDSFPKQILNPEIEDVKFVENVSTKRNNDPDEDEDEDDEEGFEFHKKTTRFVKFASPPLLTRVIEDKEMLERPPSVKKKNRKPLVSLVGWLFSKKKDRQADQEGSFHQI